MASQAMLAERLPRAKVFSLDHQGQWEDQGTGFATIEMLGHAGSVPALVVVSEVDNKSLLVQMSQRQPVLQRGPVRERAARPSTHVGRVENKPVLR